MKFLFLVSRLIFFFLLSVWVSKRGKMLKTIILQNVTLTLKKTKQKKPKCICLHVALSLSWKVSLMWTHFDRASGIILTFHVASLSSCTSLGQAGVSVALQSSCQI